MFSSLEEMDGKSRENGIKENNCQGEGELLETKREFLDSVEFTANIVTHQIPQFSAIDAEMF